MPNDENTQEEEFDTDCCYSDCDNEAIFYEPDNTGYCTAHLPQDEVDHDD